MSARLKSWGQYPDHPQVAHHCIWRDELPLIFEHVSHLHGPTLAFGNGRSYGDSCLALNDHVLALRGCNRLISFDPDSGVLRAEAGITLGEILQAVIPLGWFLPVTPGTQFVTLGGAIANDVHGKNHHVRGSFGNHVLAFGLLRSDQGHLNCSALEHSELFRASIGGLGLTGVLTWAEIQLIPVETSQIDSVTIRFRNLDEFFVLSETLDQDNEYSVAWIDCQASGKHVGRGVYFAGNHARYGERKVDIPGKLTVPTPPPFSLINKLSLRLFNEAYWHTHSKKPTRERISYEHFFYPLDGVLHWNRIYGRKGFQQYQCAIPEIHAKPVMTLILDTISQSRQGSFLAVLKRFGAQSSPGLLSFPIPGITIALDFPPHPDLNILFSKLDMIVREHGGRLYPAKDAHMSGEDFRQAYPQWASLEMMRDPALHSRFWKRVIT